MHAHSHHLTHNSYRPTKTIEDPMITFLKHDLMIMAQRMTKHTFLIDYFLKSDHLLGHNATLIIFEKRLSYDPCILKILKLNQKLCFKNIT